MDIAREVIDEAAPDEAGLFEQIWAEALENPALLRAEPGRKDQQLGIGLSGDTSLLSLLIIPVIVEIAKDAAVKGFDGVYEYARNWLKGNAQSHTPKLSEEDVNRIARAIAKRSERKSR